MAANTSPIYTLTPKIGFGTSALTAANTAYDGTGTVLTVFTAGTNGSFLQRIRFRAAGTNIQTVARVFLSNGSGTGTASNNILYDEIQLAATTASQTTNTALQELNLGFAIPNGWLVTVTLGTAVAAGYYISVVGGDY